MAEMRREFDEWQSGVRLRPPMKPLPLRISDALTIGFALTVALVASGFYDLGAFVPTASIVAYAGAYVGVPWLWYTIASWLSSRVAVGSNSPWLPAVALLAGHAAIAAVAVGLMTLHAMGLL